MNSCNIIENIDFSLIIDKLVHHAKWKRAHALEVCSMYQRFLLLQKKYGKTHKLVPSIDIDEFWHTHILDTKNYHKDCQALLGYYLHHYQYVGLDGKSSDKDAAQAYNKTRELYRCEFGEDIYEIRGPIAQIVSFIKVLLK